MEDLRNRTSENERLEMQATTVRGQVEALRELADARELEVKEQRERLARYFKAFGAFISVISLVLNRQGLVTGSVVAS